MSYRFVDPDGPLINLLGTETAAGGSVQFYDYQTTTPKNTYSDRDLTTPNPSPVPIAVDGRLSVEVWLDGEYTAVLKDEDDNTVWTRDIVPEVAPGASIPDPSGQDGKVLKSNGSILVYDTVREMPDPTGSAGEMVVVNSTGDGYVTQPIPDVPEPDITIAADKVVIGGGGSLKKMELFGSGTAPASGTTSTSVAVNFATAFKAGTIPFVSITLTNAQASGPFVSRTSGDPTSAGFTAVFDVAEGNSAGGNIVTAPTFRWKAEGVVDA